jgi:hypothetical protein
MTSKSLVVFYDQAAASAPPAAGSKGVKSAPIQSATPGPGGSSSIRRLEARGSVVVVQKDQIVTGETAIFDTKANQVTMQGGVVLTQGQNVLRGDRLVVDMTTGVSRVESDTGRVQGLFQSSGQGTPAPAPAAPSNKPKQHQIVIRLSPGPRLNRRARACIYGTARGRVARRFAGQGASPHSCCTRKSNRRGGSGGSP